MENHQQIIHYLKDPASLNCFTKNFTQLLIRKKTTQNQTLKMEETYLQIITFIYFIKLLIRNHFSNTFKRKHLTYAFFFIFFGKEIRKDISYALECLPTFQPKL